MTNLETIAAHGRAVVLLLLASLGGGCGAPPSPEPNASDDEHRRTAGEAREGQAEGATADAEAGESPRIRLKTPKAAELAGIKTVKAGLRPEGAGLAATATIAFDATRDAVVNARAPGIVRSVSADVGAKVERGRSLAVIESPQVGADRSRLDGARTRVTVAEANYRREMELQAQGISSMKDLQAAQQELQTAKSESASIVASLSAVGQSTGATGGYAVTAPITGTIVQRSASIGKLVGVEETLFEVVDTTMMWGEIDVPEDQLAKVAVGQRVIFTVDGLGDQPFEGAIVYLAPQIDPHTRTVRARAPLANPLGVLRANMFARARVIVGGGTPIVTVPAAAVQRIGDGTFVFVRHSDVEFEARRVELGAHEASVVEVTHGLQPTEDVVAEGAFLLKSELLKASLQGDDD